MRGVRIEQTPSDIFPGGETIQSTPGQVSAAELVTVLKDGTLVAFEKKLNFQTGTNTTLSVVDDPANGKADIKIDVAAATLQNTLLDGVNHTDTLAGAVARGDLIVGNSTPKWSRKAVTNNAVLRADNSGDPGWAVLANGQILIGSTGATPVVATLTAGANITITNAAGSITIAAASSSGGPTPWRRRIYHYDLGANLFLDSTYWKIGGVAGNATPGGVTQYNGLPHTWQQIGMDDNLLVIWDRLKITVTAQPQTLSWGVPAADDNFGAYVQKPGNATGTITVAGGSNLIAGTGTLFTTEYVVGDCMYVATTGDVLIVDSITNNTTLALKHNVRSGVIGGAHQVCKYLYQKSNGVAQNPVNQKSTFSLDVNGDWVLHLFVNNAHFQGAYHFYHDMADNANITLGDCGSEAF